MSEELDRKQYQPFHGLRYMEQNFGKGGVPVVEFFANVFNMDEQETLDFLEKAEASQNIETLVEKQYELAVQSLTEKLTADLFGIDYKAPWNGIAIDEP